MYKKGECCREQMPRWRNVIEPKIHILLLNMFLKENLKIGFSSPDLIFQMLSLHNKREC